MAAALRRNGNGHRAQWTFLSGGRPRWRRFLGPAVHLLNDQEHRESDNQKVDDVVQKDAVVQCGGVGRFRLRERCIALAIEAEEEG